MLSGSAFLRVVVLLIVAAGLAALVQAYWSPTSVEPEPAAVAADPPRQARTDPPSLAPTRTVPAEPRATAPPPPVVQIPTSQIPSPQPPSPQVAVAPAPVQPAPILAEPNPTARTPRPPPSAVAPLRFEPPATAADAAAADNAGPRAMAIVDLNSASIAELNALKGGGMIGRSIAQKRPYASVDQLLSKRVLNRATYDRIKDQVTVR